MNLTVFGCCGDFIDTIYFILQGKCVEVTELTQKNENLDREIQKTKSVEATYSDRY